MSTKHTWIFKRHLRSNSFTWSSSALAAKRLKEALSEIKLVNKGDSELAARGVVTLAQRVWPAFQHIDTSSGMLGNAVNQILSACIPIFSEAQLSKKVRQSLLEELFEAMQEDGVDYLATLGDNWGDLCASEDLASEWADVLKPTVVACWTDDKAGGYFRGTTACLSALLKAKRYSELSELIKSCSYSSWSYNRYEFESLVERGKKSEAIHFAQDKISPNYDPIAQIHEACEAVLLSSGLHEEAYSRFGLPWTRRNSNLATFRVLAKKYPNMDKKKILQDLIDLHPGEEGKWFATAKDLGFFEVALDLAERSPTDPKTLNRAAEKNLEANPDFAMKASLLSLRWMAEGYGYEISNLDVIAAYRNCLAAADKIGLKDSVKSKVIGIISLNSKDAFFVRDSLKRVLSL